MGHSQNTILSFDRPTFPKITLPFENKKSYKLSCGWYKEDSLIASMVNFSVDKNNYQSLLNNISFRERYNWGGMLFSLEKNIFTYRLNHRDWLMSILLQDPKKPANPDLFHLEAPFLTNSTKAYEIYATWLMSQLFLREAHILTMFDYPEIYKLFTQINEDNPCTILLSNGQDMIFYQGREASNALYYLHSCSPHDGIGKFKTGALEFQLDPLEMSHSLMMISTHPIAHKNTMIFNQQQMLVVKGSHIVWNSEYTLKGEEDTGSLVFEPTISTDYLNKIKLLKIPCKSIPDSKIAFVTVPTESLDQTPNLYSVLHKTSYEYDTPVRLSKHLFRLQPVSDLVQAVLYCHLSVYLDGKIYHCTPNNFIGAFGNHATFIEIDKAYQRLEIICRSIVSVASPPPQRFDLLHLQRNIPLIWMPWDRIMMQAYLVPPELAESALRELSDYALSFVKRNNNDVYAVLHDINRTIFNDYTYSSGSTSLNTNAYDVYVNHRGVCQDFANLFICLARLLNIPARYRTGYIHTGKDYANKAQGDASHAWLEVFLPYIGWQGYDPTNFCLAGKDHIRVACGRTYTDTAPTSGTIYSGGSSKESLSVDVRVVLMDELDEKDLEY